MLNSASLGSFQKLSPKDMLRKGIKATVTASAVTRELAKGAASTAKGAANRAGTSWNEWRSKGDDD